jgi:hypothetical protein
VQSASVVQDPPLNEYPFRISVPRVVEHEAVDAEPVLAAGAGERPFGST